MVYGRLTITGHFKVEDTLNSYEVDKNYVSSMDGTVSCADTNSERVTFEELPEPVKFEDGQIYVSRMDSNAVFKRVDGWWMSRFLPADYSSESKISDDTMRRWVVNGGVLPL